MGEQGLLWGCFLGGMAAILLVSLVWWQRVGALEWWKRRQIDSGAWERRPCPSCRGRGKCRSCQGLGTMGLMGPPCMECGGGAVAARDPGYNPTQAGERARGPAADGQPRYDYTAMGTGRCASCGGTGHAFYEIATGHTIADNPDAVAAARARHARA